MKIPQMQIPLIIDKSFLSHINKQVCAKNITMSNVVMVTLMNN